MAGSLKKVMDELSFDLSKQTWPDSGKPMYNVTLMTGENNKKYIDKKSRTFHTLLVPYDHFDIINDKGPHPLELLRIENEFMDLLLKTDEMNEIK